MEYNFSVFTSVEQCDAALIDFQERRSRVIFEKANREAATVSRASTTPLIPDRLASLDQKIANAALALEAANGAEEQANAEINLTSLRLERARLIKRSLQSEPVDIVEDQLDIANMEQSIETFDEVIAAINARKAEILAQAA